MRKFRCRAYLRRLGRSPVEDRDLAFVPSGAERTVEQADDLFDFRDAVSGRECSGVHGAGGARGTPFVEKHVAAHIPERLPRAPLPRRRQSKSPLLGQSLSLGIARRLLSDRGRPLDCYFRPVPSFNDTSSISRTRYFLASVPASTGKRDGATTQISSMP